MLAKRVSLVVGIVAAVAAWGRADGAGPKPTDFAACNAEAREAVKAGSASPNTASPNAKDEDRAAAARRGDHPTDATGKVTRSPDPQLDGMDAEGAKDSLYQAAYRTCMRRNGF